MELLEIILTNGVRVSLVTKTIVSVEETPIDSGRLLTRIIMINQYRYDTYTPYNEIIRLLCLVKEKYE